MPGSVSNPDETVQQLIADTRTPCSGSERIEVIRLQLQNSSAPWGPQHPPPRMVTALA